jgi:hypothetical protein
MVLVLSGAKGISIVPRQWEAEIYNQSTCVEALYDWDEFTS